MTLGLYSLNQIVIEPTESRAGSPRTRYREAIPPAGSGRLSQDAGSPQFVPAIGNRADESGPDQMLCTASLCPVQYAFVTGRKTRHAPIAAFATGRSRTGFCAPVRGSLKGVNQWRPRPFHIHCSRGAAHSREGLPGPVQPVAVRRRLDGGILSTSPASEPSRVGGGRPPRPRRAVQSHLRRGRHGPYDASVSPNSRCRTLRVPRASRGRGHAACL